MAKKSKKRFEHPILVMMLIFAIFASVAFVVIHNRKQFVDYNPNVDKLQFDHKQYEENEYKPIISDEYVLINSYYKDYLYLILNNQEQAWNLLLDESKENRFNNSIKEFRKYLDRMITEKTRTNSVESYKIKKNYYGKEYTVLDSENNMFIFTDQGIWNYRVEIKERPLN